MNASLLGYFRHQFVAAPLTRLIWMIPIFAMLAFGLLYVCLLYTSDAADE